MRQSLIQAAIVIILSSFGFNSHAQLMGAELLRPMTANLQGTDGSAILAGYLPSGAVVSMHNPYIVYSANHQIDFNRSLVNYFTNNNMNPYPPAGEDNYIPVQLVSGMGPNFTAGQMVFLPLSEFVAPRSVRVLDDSDEETEGRYCTECSEPRSRENSSVSRLQRIPPPAIQERSSRSYSQGSLPKFVAGTRGMNPACHENTMNPRTGKMGSFGKELARVMSSDKYSSTYTRSNALGAFCPRFNQLSETRKIEAWVWFWASLGQEESNCNLAQEHKTHVGKKRINPRPGYGYATAEKSQSIRDGRYRQGAGDCRNILTMSGQALCYVSMMKETQLDNGASAYSYGSSYWGPLRPGRARTQVMPHMKRFDECF